MLHSDNDSTEKCNFVAMLDGMEVWDKAEMWAERDSRIMKLSNTQGITNFETKDRANIFVNTWIDRVQKRLKRSGCEQWRPWRTATWHQGSSVEARSSAGRMFDGCHQRWEVELSHPGKGNMYGANWTRSHGGWGESSVK